MPALTCPSCGAPIAFTSTVAVYAVCRSCGSMVVKTGVDLEAIGKVAALPDDISPIQVGTELVWDKRRYSVLGRARIGYADGAWDEWFVDDGTQPGWLAEAQGNFSIAFPQPVPATMAGPMPTLDTVLQVGAQNFRVTDLEEATCLGSEGELPFAAPRGRRATYADMLSDLGGFAGLEDGPEGRAFYLGWYAPFSAFRFTNLRQLDGWRPPDPAANHASDPRYGTAR